MSIVNEPGKSPGEERGAMGGENVRRKELSPLRAFTDNDIGLDDESRPDKRHGKT
jgi:hypothetical protein